jgi:hypothetical protein
VKGYRATTEAAARVAFVLAVALTVAAFFVLATSAKAEDTPSPCYFIDLEKISEESAEDTRESLTAQGWYADSLDGGEFLYSPSCLSQAEHEQRALLEEVRALREEVDALRGEIRELTALVDAVVEWVVEFTSEAASGVYVGPNVPAPADKLESSEKKGESV